MRAAFVGGDVVQDGNGPLGEDVFDQFAQVGLGVASVGSDGDHDVLGLEVGEFVPDAFEQVVDRRASPAAGNGFPLHVAHDELHPRQRIVFRREISVGLGDRVAVEQQRQVARGREHANLADRHFRPFRQSETVIVVLTAHDRFAAYGSGSAAALSADRGFDLVRLSGVQVDEAEYGALVVAADVDDVFVCGVDEVDFLVHGRTAFHRNRPGGHVEVGLEFALVALEQGYGVFGEPDVVAYRPLPQRIVFVEPHDVFAARDAESFGRVLCRDVAEHDFRIGFPVAEHPVVEYGRRFRGGVAGLSERPARHSEQVRRTPQQKKQERFDLHGYVRVGIIGRSTPRLAERARKTFGRRK